jgi:hypothetical protein
VHLAFLAQYDVRGREARKYLADWRPLARADFYLREGVFSFEIADASKEFDAGVVQIYPSLVYYGPARLCRRQWRDGSPTSPWSNWKPWQLRRHVYEILDLSIPEKRLFRPPNRTLPTHRGVQNRGKRATNRLQGFPYRDVLTGIIIPVR